MTHDEARDMLAGADLVHSAEAVQAALAGVAGAIQDRLAGRYPLVLCVMTGSVVFCGQLLPRLDFPPEFDYLHATRYRGATSGGELVWKHRPATPLRGRRVLLADDILDEGHTLLAVRDWCLAEGASEVRIAALAVKQHDRCVAGICADYVGVEVPDRYVFGYGMDFHEQGRNLPAIYALKD